MAAKQWFLRDLRKELGLDQIDVEEDSGIKQPRISLLERGAAELTREERKKIVEAILKRSAVRGVRDVDRGLESFIINRK